MCTYTQLSHYFILLLRWACFVSRRVVGCVLTSGSKCRVHHAKPCLLAQCFMLLRPTNMQLRTITITSLHHTPCSGCAQCNRRRHDMRAGVLRIRSTPTCKMVRCGIGLHRLILHADVGSHGVLACDPQIKHTCKPVRTHIHIITSSPSCRQCYETHAFSDFN